MQHWQIHRVEFTQFRKRKTQVTAQCIGKNERNAISHKQSTSRECSIPKVEKADRNANPGAERSLRMGRTSHQLCSRIGLTAQEGCVDCRDYRSIRRQGVERGRTCPVVRHCRQLALTRQPGRPEQTGARSLQGQRRRRPGCGRRGKRLRSHPPSCRRNLPPVWRRPAAGRRAVRPHRPALPHLRRRGGEQGAANQTSDDNALHCTKKMRFP